MRDVSRKVKIRVAARHAESIRQAIKKSVQPKTIVNKWLDAHTGLTTEVTNNEARQWAKVNVDVDSTGLNVALRKLYATGVVLGQDLALNQLARQLKVKAPSKKDLATARNIDWSNWRPGNRAAAQLVSPEGALRRLLDARNITIRELNNTTIDRIGTILGQGLTAGATREQLAKDLQQGINELLNDPARSVVIAQTEMARAVVESNLETYKDTGVQYLEYLVADPCDDCAENLAASPISVDEQWPNGNPPVHPNCMCDVAPYIVTEDTGEARQRAEEEATVINAIENDLIDDIFGMPSSDDVPTMSEYWGTKPGAKPLTRPSELKPIEIPDVSRTVPGRWLALEPKSIEDTIENVLFQKQKGFSEKQLLKTEPLSLQPKLRAFEAYTGADYQSINNYLRNQAKYGGDNGFYDTTVKNWVKNLDALMDKAPASEKDLITYRGVKPNQWTEGLSKLKVGDTFSDSGYFSTNFTPEVARGFATESGTVLEVISPQGTRGMSVLGFKDATLNTANFNGFKEKEWLLPRGSTFEVIAKYGNTIRVVIK